MKKLITILTITFLMSSCQNSNFNSDVSGRPVITSKSILLKEGFCKYYYNGLGIRQQSFEDSCNKYSIGDTIK
jgi:hypothetical protein